MSNTVRIGVDFGGVIVKPGVTRLGEDTAEATREWQPQPLVLESIRDLVVRFSGAVHIVSKAGPRMQSLTRAWLTRTDFCVHTGLNPANVHFCRERSEKRIHCERLSITHFVDDRVDVMEILQPVVPHLFRFASDDRRDTTPSFAVHVSSWGELMAKLLSAAS